MDIYPVHLIPSVKRRALLLGFQVHFIPAGLTDQYQPLDRAVFGCLKATARSLYSRSVHDAPGGSITRRKAVEIFQESWQQLSGGVLEAASAAFEEKEQPKTSIKPEEGRGRRDDAMMR
jgi:hypothetical protein